MDVVKNNDDKKDKNEPADFEKAIDAAGFGLFNIILLLAAIPATFASVFETTTMSYILPIAECDLKLTLINKGVLNAMTYGGMIVSALVWGYLADTLGRKKILVFGYLADAICVYCSAMSQTFEMLAVFKFLGGFIVNGPGTVLFTYITELHGNKHRSRVLMILGIVTSTATLVLPCLSWAIFPRDWDFVLFNSFNVHTWQIFLAVCGLPSLISGLLITILPESPKFLMSQGRNAEALRVFQKMYRFNTRKPKSTYPITELVEEAPSRYTNANEVIYTIENKPKKPVREHRTAMQALREGLQQMKPMFRKPLLGHSIHVYTMQFCILLGLNTIRLWLPQLFASIAEYETLNVGTNSSSNLCTILEYSVNKTTATVETYTHSSCESKANVSMDMYTNNIIVATSSIVGYFFASGIVKLLGPKRMLTYGLFISGTCGMSLYWSSSGLTTLIISSFFITVSSISTSSLLGVVVTLFPTSLRALIVASAMMFGRLGALSGNMLFPVFIEIGCIPPFLMVGFVMFCAAALSCILPSPKKTTFT
ncbi:synaptic vesicle glycoprotein 2C-like [Teleopsis dalmanni]|uniref:synaptic vesicle glycoprotein 2C-like n=1 Tax=Teleopsis dalmanni TaxID=139649 RepID=UPI0018CFA3E6|nr:synaptic vesicle glycoprotein 2C-like [Teleopsis dalmanni]